MMMVGDIVKIIRPHWLFVDKTRLSVALVHPTDTDDETVCRSKIGGLNWSYVHHDKYHDRVLDIEVNSYGVVIDVIYNDLLVLLIDGKLVLMHEALSQRENSSELCHEQA